MNIRKESATLAALILLTMGVFEVAIPRYIWVEHEVRIPI